MTDNKMLNIMDDFAYNYVGPVMFEYTSWILSNCKKRNINKLYFLARDGYLLYKIAQKIVEKEKLNIDCKYLYCSRYSLRIPSYHLIEDEAFDILLLRGYHTTPLTLVERAGLTKEECNKILKEIDVLDINQELDAEQFEIVSNKLRNCESYKNLVIKKSKEAYKTTLAYLKQEGLFAQETIAIADSGWTGSMQRSLRQLCASAGFDGNFVGFYFGMYRNSTHKEDGEYLTFYFNETKNKKYKIYFNNNLFECMLSANHGMTLGYKQDKNKYIPIFKSTKQDEMFELINHQIEGALKFTDNKLLKQNIDSFNESKALKRCYNLLKKVMIYPTKDQVDMLSYFGFCDDVTENYHISLADKSLKPYLKSCMFLPRILEKFSHKDLPLAPQLYWPYGVVLAYPKILRPWYRANLKAWDYFRFTYRGSKFINLGFKFLKKVRLLFYKRYTDFIIKSKKTNPQEFAKKLLAYDVISFDMFDTLVFRTCKKPVDVFAYLEKQNNIQNFKNLRIQAELDARRNSKKFWGEININEIYKELSAKINTNIESAIMAEIEAEKKFCYANKFMLDLVKILRENNKTIIITSDMYLPSNYLNEILRNAGYPEFSNIYVSNELLKNKASGTSYKKLKDIYKDKNFIHIGDNKTSDIIKAKRLGFDTCLVKK